MRRETSNRILRLLDETLPPVVRDSPWVMQPLLRVALREHTETFVAFKDRAFTMSDGEFSGVYESIEPVASLQGETDLSRRSLQVLATEVPAGSVLEVGCGRGLLAGMLARSPQRQVTAVDIVVGADLPERYPTVSFRQASAEALPFADDSFDTVVCTHTLEHVQDLPGALAELRRVGRRRLFIVVPRQRPYAHTFNLHIHYFPYRWSVAGAFRPRGDHSLRDVGGDWHYVEWLDQGPAEATRAPRAPVSPRR